MANSKFTIHLDGVPVVLSSLGDMRKAAQSLEDQLANADLGSKKFDDLVSQLAKVKSALKNVDEATDGLTTEAKIGAISASAAGLAGAFAAAEGAAALLGAESEDLQKTMVKVQAAMAIAGGVQQLGVGLTQAQKAMTAFGISTKVALGPIAIFLAAAAAIAAAVLLMRESTSAATKAQEAYGEALKAQAPALATARIELDKTVVALKATAAGTQERSDALEELQKQYPEYISNIDKEKAKTGDLAEVIDIATKAMENKIRMQAAADVAQKAMTKQIAAELELRELATKAGIDYDKFLKGLSESGAETDGVMARLLDNTNAFAESAARNVGELFTGTSGKIGLFEANAKGSSSYRDLRAAMQEVQAALAIGTPLQEADTAAKKRATEQNRALEAATKAYLEARSHDNGALRESKKLQEEMRVAAAEAGNEEIRTRKASEELKRTEAERIAILANAQLAADNASRHNSEALREEQRRNEKTLTQETKDQANARIQAALDEAKARRAAMLAMGQQLADAGLGIAQAINGLLNQMDADRLAYLDKQMQAEQAAIAATDQKLAQSAEKQKTLEANLAHASTDQRGKVLHLMDLEEKQRQKLLVQKAQEAKQEKQLEDEKKKIMLAQFERNKELQEGQAFINVAAAVIKALTDAPFPLNIVLSTAAGVEGGIEIAKIASQKPPSFAEGRWTGAGFGMPDKSGYKMAGVVHEMEYVIPKRVAYNPIYRPLMDNVEQAVVHGNSTQGGGNGGAAMGGVEQRLDMLNDRIAELAARPSVVSVREITDAQKNTSKVMARATL